MGNNQEKYKYDLLKAKIDDAIFLSKKRNNSIFTNFYTLEEQAFINNYLKKTAVDFDFLGGFEEAQRKILAVYSRDDLKHDKLASLVALEFIYKNEYNLSHRDFLGSIMAKGVKREFVGDILVSPGRTVLFIKSEIENYIKTQVEKIGNVGVIIKNSNLENLPCAYKLEDKIITVSSLRLDNIVSNAVNESREKSAKLINSSLVSVNHSIKENISYNVRDNDVISIKGKGKFIVSEVTGFTKKGRIKVLIKFYC